MSVIILDLDNTIADDAWRIRKINWQKTNPQERYHDYHLLSAFDEAGNTDLFRNCEHRIVVLTARPVAYHALTTEWLMRKGVAVEHLIMRNNGDHRHSRDLKRMQLQWLPQLYGIGLDEIQCAYDDREDVVQMYREHGVTAQVRSIHNVCAYTAPTKETA